MYENTTSYFFFALVTNGFSFFVRLRRLLIFLFEYNLKRRVRRVIRETEPKEQNPISREWLLVAITVYVFLLIICSCAAMLHWYPKARKEI